MLLLVDGQSVLYTGFYATFRGDYNAVMKNSEGQLTNGVYMMTQKLLKIIKTQQPVGISVAWDKSREKTFRRELFAGYKSTRTEKNADLTNQIGMMQEVLSLMGIHQCSHDRFEADDFLFTLAQSYQNDIPVKILSRDQDLLQTVTEQTSVWLTNGTKEKYPGVPGGCTEYTPALVKETYGIHPYQFPDLKGILGEPTDNIPGVPGVGKKTALPLVQLFESIEKLYSFIEGPANQNEFVSILKENGIKRSPLKTLNENKKLAFLSKELATLAKIPSEHLNLPFLDIPSLSYSLNIPKLELLFRKLEFKTLGSLLKAVA